MAYLSALLAQQGGAADQRVSNYKDHIAAEAKLEALNEQQKQWDRDQANSDREFARLQKNDAQSEADYQAQIAAQKAEKDRLNGVGVVVPPNLIPKNHGVKPTNEQMAQNAETLAEFYDSKGAFDKAAEYRDIARTYATMANNDQKNSLADRKEAALEKYRQASLAAATQRFDSTMKTKQQEFAQQMATKVSEFAAAYQQRGQIANLNASERTYIAQLAGAYRVQGMDEEAAVRSAIAQYDARSRYIDSEMRSLDPDVSAAGAATGQQMFGGAGGGGQPITINVNPAAGGLPTAPAGNVSTMIPGANGSPAIPTDPNLRKPPGAIIANPKPPTANAARQSDPKVSAAVPLISDALKSGAKVADIARRLQQKLGLTPEQVQAALVQAGAPLPLPAGGMRGVLNATPQPGQGSPGGAAPASPFLLPTQ